MSAKTTQGGKREGAGRKAGEPLTIVQMRLPQRIVDVLDRYSMTHGKQTKKGPRALNRTEALIAIVDQLFPAPK